MHTFIFMKYKWKNNKQKKVIVGMVQSTHYPSRLVNDKESEFFGCLCIEVKEHCHIEL